jgi:hypothetical protein
MAEKTVELIFDSLAVPALASGVASEREGFTDEVRQSV